MVRRVDRMLAARVVDCSPTIPALGSDAGGSVPVIAMSAFMRGERACIVDAGFQASLPSFPFSRIEREGPLPYYQNGAWSVFEDLFGIAAEQ
jgi:hypothetical protein